MLRHIFLTGAALAPFALPAVAADLTYEEPAPVIAATGFDWTGPYIGVHAGYGWSDVDYDSLSFGFLSDDGSYDLEGFIGGVQAGFNWQTNAFVYGVEADFTLSGVDGDSTSGFGVPIGRDIDWTSSLRGRLGYAFDRYLVYGTAGAALAQSEGSVDGFGSDEELHLGWTVGGGVEAKLTQAISLRAEYLYADYGSEDYSYGDGLIQSDVDLTQHTLRIGLNYQF